MAGIGFRLQALVSKGSYLEAVAAYVSSAVITAGPWISGVAALGILSTTAAAYLKREDHIFLVATIMLVFAASLLVAGGPQMVLSRYLADRIYSDDIASLAPCCTGVLLLNIPFALLAAPFLWLGPSTLPYRVLVVALFLTLTMTWLITIFLSAAHGYKRIVLIYVSSYAIGCLASLVLGYRLGIMGCMAGFLFGQLLCLSLLLGSVYREFPSAQGVSVSYLSYLSKYWDLLLIGAGYTLCTWIDSIIFWMSPGAETIHGFYRLFPPYDSTRFLVYLTTVPAAAVFMIRLETNFCRHYSDFFRLIQQKGTLDDLVRARNGMLAAARSAAWTILKIQGFMALFLCVVARDFVIFLGLAPHWLLLLRIQAFSGLGQFLLFVMMIFLLYLDQRRKVLLVVGLFLLLNIALTLLSLVLGETFYGVGYLIAGWAGAFLGWHLLNAHCKHLEFQTFMSQPVG